LKLYTIQNLTNRIQAFIIMSTPPPSPNEKSRIGYEEYMASSRWREKCEMVLERDGHECRTCPSTSDLEVHHRTYERFGNEDLDDLVTLCHECHEAITSVFRNRRYQNHTYEPSEVMRITPSMKKEENEDGPTNYEIQTHRRITPTYAQRTTGRPPE